MEYLENLVRLPDIETQHSFSGLSKHEFKLKLQHSHTSRWTRPSKLVQILGDGNCLSFRALSAYAVTAFTAENVNNLPLAPRTCEKN